MKPSVTDLAKYINKHFGSVDKCSEELGVTSQTVYNWINKNPRGMLKFAPEIVHLKNTTWTQLSGEVMYHEEALRLEK